MAKNSLVILNKFKNKINTLEKIRQRQENLLLNNQLFLRDVEEVYLSLFISTIVSFEALIEELFFGLLSGIIQSRKPRVNTRIKIKSIIIAHEIFYQDKKFFNWLPYENTEEVAYKFFTGGRPFTNINNNDRGQLEECRIIRNVIAHSSRHAKNLFNKKIISNITINPRNKQVKKFLRSQFSFAPRTNYYVHYISEILKISERIC